MSELSVVLEDKPFTKTLKSRAEIAGLKTSFPSVDPIRSAFPDMVRSQRYDVCEMAIGTYLQARDAGKPLLLLPVAVLGSFKHKSLFGSPASNVSSVADLKGARVGVRSYSQTTGLWVRGWMEEEFDLPASAMTWAVTNRSHSDQYEDPDNVVLLDGKLTDALYSGRIDAAITSQRSVPDLRPLVPDFAERDRAWYQRHGCVPINHMVVVTTRLASERPDVVREVYRLLADGMVETSVENNGLPPGPRSGLDEVRRAVELAAEYACRQALISAPVTEIEALFCFDGRLD
ncbi:hypothetical protein RB614_23830 [Phytohabitans sp. ZYX-F-186]|uniref:4,5-dihydroxyphthalate decarboxylase n=1 Tax=Phytohabitans maris TaxID=3071409 RepID=A0ABU0ZKK3_9ACTN|nr:hypothetical protein [Phytohabitans sp. ZYX-F-186]MDQ7907555.1 hypothetical protein [Phytohabitans sp. ZYX-F-186]